MKHRIELPMHMKKCPIWWQNFVRSRPIKIIRSGETVDEYESTYCGRRESDSVSAYIEFESEEAAVLFILKWS